MPIAQALRSGRNGCYSVRCKTGVSLGHPMLVGRSVSVGVAVLYMCPPCRYSSLGAPDSPPDYSLEDRTGDLGGQEEDKEDKEDGGRVTRELSSMSRTCRESFEEEEREEEQEEEERGEQELCTISEEQGEA